MPAVMQQPPQLLIQSCIFNLNTVQIVKLITELVAGKTPDLDTTLYIYNPFSAVQRISDMEMNVTYKDPDTGALTVIGKADPHKVINPDHQLVLVEKDGLQSVAHFTIGVVTAGDGTTAL